jgi:photosystem II stability/assembly factor-like uncharacterized protein
MKTKLLLFMLLTALVMPDVFSQKASFWSRIPESIKSRKVYKRFEWDYKQRAFPYDTIPAARYRQERSREILKLNSKISSAVENCEWRPTGPGGVLFDNSWGLSSGRVKAVAVHPTDQNTLYIGAAGGGIWKSTNGGATWLDIGRDLESLNFGAIAIDPDNPQTIYAGSGEACLFSFNTMYDGKGLFKSTDGGQSWITINNGFGEYTHFSDIAVNPHNSNIVLASIASGNFFVGDSLPNEGVWKSTDAGLTWNRTLNEEDAYDILFHPVNPAIVYATIGGMQPNSGFYISTDEGNTWTQSNAGLPDPTEIGRMQIDLSHSSPNILYAVIYKLVGSITETTKAFKSVDGGINWAQIAAGIPLGGYGGTEWYDQGWYDLCIAVDPTNPNHVFIGNVELHETFDGSVFSPVRPYGINNLSGSLVHVDYHQLVYAPSNPSYLYIGCDGGIYKSTDGGSTATSLNNGLETLQFYRIASSPFDSLVVMGGMQDNGNALTRDGGITWNVVTGADGMECFFDYADSTIAYASIQYGAFYKSNNGGATFNYFISCGTGCWITPFFMHPTIHTTLYAATGSVYRKTGGAFMKISNNVVPAPAYVSTMAQSSVNPDHMILASGGFWENYPLSADSLFKVKISTDGGFHWNDVTINIPGDIRWISRVVTDPVNPDCMYMLRTGFSPSNKLYKTTDLGNTWTNISGDLPDLPTSDVFIDPQNTDHIYVATDIGVYFTINGGNTWELQGEGIPFVPVMDFDYVVTGSRRILRIGTHGRSIYETTLSPLVGIDRFTIYDLRITIYPNPFTGSETFSYALNESSQVTLQIFDSFGQMVAEPLKAYQSQGEQQFEWNSGRLPAGMYYYRIQAGKQVGSGKMMKN